ncbi:hypothetical protein GSI_02902 [Ganoderma sinense ZZ0214-1]|uniref:Uncharacterized protein n=1 Tax=Ganoderma sinense ZZ0214-1 TaxID=1077348 RepID=A0A2G8SMW7_9APHY|nr:hypothetical protein GSI_02902 [Ganoderma sinense ZZ0214-1]
MLWMVCQQDTQDSGGGGRDARTYDAYLQGCSPIVNNTLPSNIQAAVCNNNIRIDSFLYDLGWPAGDCGPCGKQQQYVHALPEPDISNGENSDFAAHVYISGASYYVHVRIGVNFG